MDLVDAETPVDAAENPMGSSDGVRERSGSDDPEQEQASMPAKAFLTSSEWSAVQVEELQAYMDAKDRRASAWQLQTMKDVFGSMTENVPNWHQAAVYFATTEDPASTLRCDPGCRSLWP